MLPGLTEPVGNNLDHLHWVSPDDYPYPQSFSAKIISKPQGDVAQIES
jgi:hypothetical protein